MKNFIDKEYHPVIENFITDYVDDEMDAVEQKSFEEVLVHDDDLRELAFSAKEGKRLMSQFRKVKAKDDFIERLKKSVADS
jgi:hemerythrin-like domain-containing protein